MVILLTFISFSCASANTPIPGERPSDFQPTNLPVRTELSSAAVVAGSILVIRIAVPVGQRKNQIVGHFEGIEFPFYPLSGKDNGVYEGVLGVPYERKSGSGSVSVLMGEGGSPSQFEIPFQIQEGEYPSEKLRVDGRRVNPTSKKDVKRILKEQAEVAGIYRRVTPRKYWPGPFHFPIKSRITSPFGTRRVYNGQLRGFHPGLDLKAPLKTPVHSAAPGVVVLAKSLFFTGNTVMIDHGYGIITLYAHMSRLKVKKGDSVKISELLGWSGKTGRVNGPHLHWQAVVHRVKVNPLGLVQVIR